MSGKIPVTVICGALGSGKSSFINRLLLAGRLGAEGIPDVSNSVVLINEAGQVRVDHAWVLMVKDDVSVTEGACTCCTVRGELVVAMRELFLQALRKEIPAFSRVIIEASGQADPSPIMTTLQYERFLAERYAYASSICVIDATQDAAQLQGRPPAAQQAVMADTLILSKTDMAPATQIAHLKRSLSYLNPDASIYDVHSLPSLAPLLQPARWHPALHRSATGGSLWAGRPMEHPVHAGISVATLTWAQPLVRSRFNRAMQALQGDGNLKLLRVKGLLHFEGHKQASEFHGFHQQLFPVETSFDGSADVQSAGRIDASSSDSAPAVPDQDSMLVLVYRGQASAQLAGLVATLLPGASGSLSPARNFVQ